VTGSLEASFRVLLYAHVDLNVIDGSAFFVAGAASLLTSAPGVVVDVVAATPIKRPVVVHEMLVNDRVSLTDPFADADLAARRPEFAGISRMTEGMAATALDHYLDRGQYDVVVVRNTEVADALASLRPDLGSRLCLYVTGVVSADVPVDTVLRGKLTRLVASGATLLCQTPEMRDHLARTLADDAGAPRLALMSPSVPAESDVVLPGGRGPLALAYTGKFAPAWHTVEMVAGFKEARSAGADLRLVVAGDHFKRSEEWPTFAAEVRYLLGSHPDIRWVGAVTRAESRALVARADAGLSWRHASLDASLELSTKLLEHGALGRPCVVNPTAMHRRLFGADYPLYAASMSDFVSLLRRMSVDRGLVRAAAEVAMTVAADYTYERVFDEVFPTLLDASLGPGRSDDDDFTGGLRQLLRSGERLVRYDGWTLGWLADADDAVRVLASAGAHDPLHSVERRGPFVRWRSDGNADGHTRGPSVSTLELVVDVLATERAAKASVRDVAAAGAVTVSHDLAGRVGLAAAPLAPAAEPAADAPTIADRSLMKEIEQASVDLARQAQENARLTRRYEALSESRFGRIQLAYWRLRGRARRRPRTTA
jgi:hypothetical protein